MNTWTIDDTRAWLDDVERKAHERGDHETQAHTRRLRAALSAPDRPVETGLLAET